MQWLENLRKRPAPSTKPPGQTIATETTPSFGYAFNRPAIASLLLSTAVVVLPSILSFLLALPLGIATQPFTPSYEGAFNDGIYYWRQSYTFAHVGFNGGYYTLDEYPAPAEVSHYYFYGPFVIALYGAFGRLFGWYPTSALVVHVLAVSTALALLVGLLRLTLRQRVMLLVLMGTFLPLLFFLLSNMQEPLHYATAILFSIGFYRVLSLRHETPRGFIAALWIFIAVAGVMRVTWALLFLPLFLFTAAPGDRKIVSLAKTAASMLPVFAVFFYFSAPYPTGFLYQGLEAVVTGDGSALRLLLTNVGENIGAIFEGALIEVAQRFVILLFLIHSLWLILKPVAPQLQAWLSGTTRSRTRRRIAKALTIVLFVLACLIVVLYSIAPLNSGLLMTFSRALVTWNDPALPILGQYLQPLIPEVSQGLSGAIAIRLVGLPLIILVFALWRKRSLTRSSTARLDPARRYGSRVQNSTEHSFHAINLGLPLLLNVVVYNSFNFRDFRALAPHLLLSLILMVLYRRYRFVLSYAALSLLMLGPFLESYQTTWRSQFTYDPAAIQQFGEQIAGIVEYDPETPNAWCNTIYIEFGRRTRIYPELMALPPGIGVTLGRRQFLNDRLEFRSKFVLISPKTFTRYRDEFRLTRLLKTSIGIIYRNEDATCDG